MASEVRQMVSDSDLRIVCCDPLAACVAETHLCPSYPKVINEMWDAEVDVVCVGAGMAAWPPQSPPSTRVAT